MAWPADLAARFREPEFSASLEVVKGECPGVFPANATADCSEFPCRILWVSPQDPPQGWGALGRACPPFEEAFGRHAGTWSAELTKLHSRYRIVSVEPVSIEPAALEYRTQWRGNIRVREDARLRKRLPELAAAALEPACLATDTDSCFALGTLYAKKGAVALAQHYLDAACSLGSTDACATRAR